MALSDVFDAIAELTASLDATDLPGLVDLQERLESAMDAAGAAGRTRMASGCREAAQLASAIIFRESDDATETFDRLRESVEAICHAARGDADLPPEVADRLIGTASSGGDHVADDVDLELLGSWVGSTADHLGTLEAIAIELDAPATPDPERIAEARRIIHTLKGEAGFLSLESVRTLCHEVESLIDRRESTGERHRGDEVLALVDWLKRVIDVLSDDPTAELPPHAAVLDAITAGRGDADAAGGPRPATGPGAGTAGTATAASAGDPAFDDPAPVTFSDDMGMDENLGEFIGEAREHLAAAEESLLALEQDPTDNELINTVFRAFHTVKGVAGFMNLGPIVEFAHEAETLLDHARNDKLRLDARKLDLVLRACDHLEQLVGALEGGDAPTLGLHRRLLDALVRTVAGETVDLGGATPPSPASEVSPANAPAVPDAGARPSASAVAPRGGDGGGPDAARDGGRKTRIEQTVKVTSSRLDGLVTMVGELVIAQQMVVQDPVISEIAEQRVQRSLAQVSKIIRDLQGVSMALSMVPVRGTFQKMARLVRDVSGKAGKKVHFVMEGEDTELDRNVVEEIGDPLVHMVRNACDHGIETPADRAAAGKPEHGTLTLRAYHQGGAIIIEIRDDGRGLNRERILAKAVERGLVPADRKPDDIPDHEVYNMIFMPGFSTAEKITDISGRGVGMDVVRRNIEALRGAVEIDSTPGKGSIFRMKLPLTMAIIDGMVVRVGQERFVVPTLAIEQSFQPTDAELETTMQEGEMARIRGDLLPIHRLKRIFALDEGHDDLRDGLLLVLESTEGRFCLAVDHIMGQQQVVIKSLGSGVKPIRGVAGGAILGDGRVALILDITGIVEQANSDEAPADIAAAGASGA